MSAIRDIGSPEQLEIMAGQGCAPLQRPAVNSHIHLPPNFSAFDTVAQAVDLAAEQGVGMVGVSNYYDFSVYDEFAALARPKGIFPLFGLELIALIDELVAAGVKINDPGNPGKMYICGKGMTRFDGMMPRANELLAVIRRNDSQRMREMIEKLVEVFQSFGLDTGLDESAVINRVARRHGCDRETVYLQERHLAQAFQEVLFTLVPAESRVEKLGEIFGAPSQADAAAAVKIQGEIRSHLMKAGKRCFVDETFGGFDEAFELVCELGGIPCYPTLADGTDPVCEYEQPVGKLIDTLEANKIHMAELVPIRNSPEVLTCYVKAMREAGLVVVGGTEHNTLDLLPIEPACAGGAAVPEEIKNIFVEGAYVIAAHQFLTACGECGFVDAEGDPNPAYENSGDRIDAFAKLGAAVVQQYLRDR